jgi:AcrR family transcriptional regulator
MSTKDRRARERAEREQRFLDKAQELIQRDGLLSLQMSRIAEECDYAIGTLYQHFASKEDLLVTLSTRNCMGRVTLFERAARWPGPSRERMLAIALADLMVIRARPEHFRLEQFVWTDVIWGAASAQTRQRSLDASAPLGALIEGIVRSAIAEGDLRADIGLSPQAVTIGPWTLSLGIHTLTHAEGLLEAYSLGEPYRLLMKHLHFLLNGYGWLPLFDPADDDALDALNTRLCREVFGSVCQPVCPTACTTPVATAFRSEVSHD